MKSTKSTRREVKLFFRIDEDMLWEEIKDNGDGLEYLGKYAKVLKSKGFEVKLNEHRSVIESNTLDVDALGELE